MRIHRLTLWSLVLLITSSSAWPCWGRSAAADFVDLQALSTRIVDLTNQARRGNGLSPAFPLSYLTTAATGHSAEMLDLDYFSHFSPTPGRTRPKERVQLAGGWDGAVSENIYRCRGIPMEQIAERTVSAWLESPTHYKNIMNPMYNSVGVGLARAGDSYAVTQVFSLQAIIVDKLVSTPAGESYDFFLQGKVREGSKEGAVFVDGKPVTQFQAAADGSFSIKVTIPAGTQVSVGLKKTVSSFSTALEFPVEAGLMN